MKDEIYEMLKDRIIEFGKLTCYPINTPLIFRDIKLLFHRMDDTETKVSKRIVEPMIERFIKEMDYVKYDIPEVAAYNRAMVCYEILINIREEGFIENKATLIFRGNVYVDRTIATMMKLIK
jgi:hypothetical protein